MNYILLIASGLYFVFNALLIKTWLKIINNFNVQDVRNDSKLTIIIPVRNEAENIIKLLQDLENQDYPKQNFEVIIANDGSTDNTADLVLTFQEHANFSIRLLNIFDKNNLSPKKRAIQKSIDLASGELIITTDGDCRVPVKWLSSIQQFYKSTNAKFISSSITFTDDKSFWNAAQIIEFASLVGSGACAMYLKQPNMCNGANIAYTKEAFVEVDGFAGNEHLASGDDEFLMHKISKKYPDKVLFNANPDTIVKTNSQPNLYHFYQQRKRWASKWKEYNDWKISALAIFIFSVNLGTIVAYFLLPSVFSLTVLLLKFSLEFIFLVLIIRYLGYKSKIVYIPIVQMFYPFYVLLFGLVGQGRGYKWKGRDLK